MGCDIHLHVEVRDQSGNWSELEGAPSYRGRNYELFAMLADVRNYGETPGEISEADWLASADHGMLHSDRIDPIDEPRGLPDDVSAAVQQSSDEWGIDGHSHSWFTVEELLSVDWATRMITYRGYVSPEQFYRFKRFNGSIGTTPESWCGYTSGEKITNDEMMRRIENGELWTPWSKGDKPSDEKLWRHPYTPLQWTVTWSAAIGEFSRMLLELSHIALTQADGLDGVRIVFWFDN